MTKTRSVKRISLIWIIVFSAPLFAAALFVSRFSRPLQLKVFLAAALTYLLAAILHHLRDKSLTLEIVVEYILIAILALVVFQSLVV